jgi:hypothetical protein
VEAAISTGEGDPVTGDVELHLNASDWRRHGHDRDPTYNGVILHVVWAGDGAIVLESGKGVPTMNLRDCLCGSLDDVRHWIRVPMPPSEPCHGAAQRLGHAGLCKLLEEAGEERFRQKAMSFATALEGESASQVLYQGVMGALGYSKNKDQFEELSRRLPLPLLEGVSDSRGHQERIQVMKALLLGTAGLLPRSGDEELLETWRRLGHVEAMDSASWRLFRVRPDNHPVRRLVGAAHILSGFMERGGLLNGVLGLLEAPGPVVVSLEECFTVRGAERPFEKERTLVGQGRARDIVVNVVLPFAYAWAEASSQPGLEERVLGLYGSHPKAGENEITSGLAGLLLDLRSRRLVDSARRQQGLIHLVKSFCRRRRCAECPVSGELGAVAVCS